MDNATDNLDFSGDILSKKKLEKTWKSLTKKPFPHGKIKACVLNTEEADKAWKALRNSSNIRNCTVPEYGRELPLDERTGAVTFVGTVGKANDCWIILIRKDSSTGPEENLKHELRHIINGEITLDKKAFGQSF